ncbi:MAG: hypothetical protein QXJ40_05920 [Candidatus Bathyarchaeia archaeon]
MQPRIDDLKNLNKDDYLRAIAEHIVTSCGTPVDWGTSNTIPAAFGLADYDSPYLYKLDVDKICRLNSENGYSLSYPQVSKSARLTNIALGISISQMLSISVIPSANTSTGDATEYTFKILISQSSAPASANLHCYVVAKDFLSDVFNVTSSAGVGYVSVQIPNSASGPALLIVFARATFDDRITAYEAYSFAHLAQNPAPNHTFLKLSPLNYTLTLGMNFQNITIAEAYAFSYAYQANLTMINADAYGIPAFLDKSPIILVLAGLNSTDFFIEWASYPSVPIAFGSSFSDSEENVFVYIVTIKETLYELTLSFGDVVE